VSSTVFGSRNPFYGMRRYPDAGVVAGVCEGLAVHFDFNPRIVRVVAVLLLIFTAFWPVMIAYCLTWYIVDPVKGPPPARAPVPPSTAEAPAPSPGTETPTPMPQLKARFGKLEDRLRQIEACVTSEEFELRRELKKLEA